jgi:hypothetical protein
MKSQTAVKSGWLMMVTLCPSVALAWPPPIPAGAADLFVPAISSLTATDLCVIPGSSNSRCAIPPHSFEFDLQPFYSMKVDAVGSVYLEGTNNVGVGQCAPAGGLEITEWWLFRMTPSGAEELIGVFRDACEASYLREARPIESPRVLRRLSYMSPATATGVVWLR